MKATKEYRFIDTMVDNTNSNGIVFSEKCMEKIVEDFEKIKTKTGFYPVMFGESQHENTIDLTKACGKMERMYVKDNSIIGEMVTDQRFVDNGKIVYELLEAGCDMKLQPDIIFNLENGNIVNPILIRRL